MEKRSKKAKRSIKCRLPLFLLLLAIIAAALFFLNAAKKEADEDERFTMSSNAERVEFLNSQGLIVSPDPIKKEEITIPAEFNELYAEYAELQAAQGFDLSRWKGKKAMLISYRVLNYPNCPENVTANMLIADNRLIGGDVALSGENGFTEPLVKSGITN